MSTAPSRSEHAAAASRPPRLKDLGAAERAGYIADMISELRRLAAGADFDALRRNLFDAEEEARRIAG